MKSLDERISQALDLRRQGYNCVQSVIMVFDDITGLDHEIAAKITSAMGSGVAGTRNICGVANAIALTIGMLHGSDPGSKAAASAEARPLIEKFQQLNDNRIQCRDLKGVQGIRPCNELVAQGVEILHNHFVSRS